VADLVLDVVFVEDEAESAGKRVARHEAAFTWMTSVTRERCPSGRGPSGTIVARAQDRRSRTRVRAHLEHPLAAPVRPTRSFARDTRGTSEDRSSARARSAAGRNSAGDGVRRQRGHEPPKPHGAPSARTAERGGEEDPQPRRPPKVWTDSALRSSAMTDESRARPQAFPRRRPSPSEAAPLRQ